MEIVYFEPSESEGFMSLEVVFSPPLTENVYKPPHPEEINPSFSAKPAVTFH